MIIKYYIINLSVILFLFGCEKNADIDGGKDLITEEINEDRGIITYQEKRLHKSKIRELEASEDKNRLTEIAKQALGREFKLEKPQESKVTQDEAYFYVTWPNHAYTDSPEAPGGGVFQVKVILDKRTQKVVMIKLPN